MNGGDLNLACAWALVDELAASGVQHACLSPGSRSTPLALALSRHPGIHLHIQLDERSSAFVALGIARATGRAVAIACTSGTAATELFPAIVEASQARVPVIALTADRPPRLRGTGANQTIDQAELYGRFVRAFVEPPVPVREEDPGAWRRAGRDAIGATHGLPIGPSHVNCPFDEPLLPAFAELPAPSPRHARPSGPKPWEDLAGADDAERVARAISGKRGAIVAGPRAWEDSGDVGALADPLGWPLLAEPLSGLRRSTSLRMGRAPSLSAGQWLVGTDTWAATHRPEVVLQIGAAPTTRAMQGFVASAEQLIVIDVHHLEPDPEHRATLRIHAQPMDVLGMLGSRPIAADGEPFGITVREGDPAPSPDEPERSRIAPAPFGWLTGWAEADRTARTAVERVLDADRQPSGLRTARDVAASIPDGGILLVGNSTPVRDLDVAMVPRDGLTILGNRGASGIDGLVSTALGVAVADRGPTFALLGDLSFVHDVGALVWSARHDPPDLTLVVVRNGGGQIFSLLDQRALREHGDLFFTPHHADLEALVLATGAAHVRVEDANDLPGVVADPAAGIRVVEVVVDADHDRRVRAEVGAVVTAALTRAT